jgi:WhiB family transcriptional regulator, redox-sensing transcriptional regulator
VSSQLPCQNGQPDLWFAEQPDVLARAQALCRQCPLRRQCLDDALARREPWGVWGGQIVQHGAIIAHKRGRGRPRKLAAAS